MIHLGSHSSSLQRADCWERLYSLMVSPTYARNGWETSNVARENWRRRSRSSAAKSGIFLHESGRLSYIIGVITVPDADAGRHTPIAASYPIARCLGQRR